MENSGKKSTRDYVREKSDQAVTKRFEELVTELNKEGYEVSFGSVGKKTTYCLIAKNDDTETEFVGFTFIRNLKYMNEKVGKLKALQQALARKEMSETKEQEVANQ